MTKEPWVDKSKFRRDKMGNWLLNDKNLEDIEMLREQHLNGHCSPGTVKIRGGEENVVLLTPAQHDSWVQGSKNVRGDTQRSKEKALTDMSYEGIWKLIRGCSPPPHLDASAAAAGQMRQANEFRSGYSLDEDARKIDLNMVHDNIRDVIPKPGSERSDSGYSSARGAGGANPTSGGTSAEDKQQQEEKNPAPPPVQQPTSLYLQSSMLDSIYSNSLALSFKYTGGEFGSLEAYAYDDSENFDETHGEPPSQGSNVIEMEESWQSKNAITPGMGQG